MIVNGSYHMASGVISKMCTDKLYRYSVIANLGLNIIEEDVDLHISKTRKTIKRRRVWVNDYTGLTIKYNNLYVNHEEKVGPCINTLITDSKDMCEMLMFEIQNKYLSMNVNSMDKWNYEDKSLYNKYRKYNTDNKTIINDWYYEVLIINKGNPKNHIQLSPFEGSKRIKGIELPDVNVWGFYDDYENKQEDLDVTYGLKDIPVIDDIKAKSIISFLESNCFFIPLMSGNFKKLKFLNYNYDISYYCNFEDKFKYTNLPPLLDEDNNIIRPKQNKLIDSWLLSRDMDFTINTLTRSWVVKSKDLCDPRNRKPSNIVCPRLKLDKPTNPVKSEKFTDSRFVDNYAFKINVKEKLPVPDIVVSYVEFDEVKNNYTCTDFSSLFANYRFRIKVGFKRIPIIVTKYFDQLKYMKKKKINKHCQFDKLCKKSNNNYKGFKRIVLDYQAKGKEVNLPNYLFFTREFSIYNKEKQIQTNKWVSDQVFNNIEKYFFNAIRIVKFKKLSLLLNGNTYLYNSIGFQQFKPFENQIFGLPIKNIFCLISNEVKVWYVVSHLLFSDPKLADIIKIPDSLFYSKGLTQDTEQWFYVMANDNQQSYESKIEMYILSLVLKMPL
jgi:hypothetical protein